MTTVHELAAIVGRTVTDLKQISRTPGHERYRGTCPGHSDHDPSLDVWVGDNNEGRFFCRAHCDINGPEDKGGDAGDWQAWLRGQRLTTAAARPAPSKDLEKNNGDWRKAEVEAMFDRNPDLPDEARLFVQPTLRERLLRHLHKDDLPVDQTVTVQNKPRLKM